MHSFVQLNYKKDNSSESLYLYQLGTDGLELLFSTLRTISHSPNCDFLELKERLVITEQVEKVYAKHPDWRQKSRTSASLVVDRSKFCEWSGNLTTNHIDIVKIWTNGLKQTQKTLINTIPSTSHKNKTNTRTFHNNTLNKKHIQYTKIPK